MRVRSEADIKGPRPEISVILPVLNESESLIRAVPELEKALEETGKTYEIIVVDDESTDGTEAVLDQLSRDRRVIVLDRRWKLGLSSAVVDGFNVARGLIFGVLDADLSHDIRVIPELVKALEREDCMMAVGSRYIEGGGVDHTWPFKRRLVSRAASLLARPLTSVRDPLSGFFFFRKSLLDRVKLKTTGFKICLEVLVKTRCRSAVEIPYVFTDRKFGRSKLSVVVILGYLVQLLDLVLFKVRDGKGAGR